MNTMLLNRHVLAGGLLLLLTLLSHPSRAEGSTALLENARACAEESSRLERLNCYDALFKTPTPSVDTSELPALWHAIERQEAARAGDDMGLIIREAGSDVLISVPALGTTPPRPIMVMACEKLITRFQLHMPVAPSPRPPYAKLLLELLLKLPMYLQCPSHGAALKEELLERAAP